MVTLIQSGSDPHSGAHSAGKLSRAVAQGKLLRVAPGVYIDPDDWLGFPKWDRHLISCAAFTLANPGAVFCAESALAAFGVSLYPTPEQISVVSSGYGQAGQRRQPPLTGAAPQAAIDAMLQRSAHISTAGSGLRRLQPIPVHRREPPLPQGFSRRAHREAVAAGRIRLAEPRVVRPRLSDGTILDHTLRAEPPAQALLTSVAKMSMESGVIAADDARRGEGTLGGPVTAADIAESAHLLRTRPMQKRFRAAWDFSDPRSESAGESLSRVLIHQLGFVAPQLQRSLTLASGRTVRVDFWWDDVQLIGEFDGLLKYRQAYRLTHRDPVDAVIEEKRREDALRGLGCGFLRWTWDDLQHPRRFARMLTAAGVPMV